MVSEHLHERVLDELASRSGREERRTVCFPTSSRRGGFGRGEGFVWVNGNSFTTCMHQLRPSALVEPVASALEPPAARRCTSDIRVKGG
jgi:hypothetical protein